MRRHRKSPDGFRAIRASHGVRAAVATAWALARSSVRCSSRWVGSRSVRGLGRGLDPGGRDGRSPSQRPGGTGAEAVATPTTLPAGHYADSPAKPTASTGGDRWSAGEHPATGRLGDERTPRKVRKLSALLTMCANCQCGNGLCGRAIHNHPKSIPHCSPRPPATPRPPARGRARAVRDSSFLLQGEGSSQRERCRSSSASTGLMRSRTDSARPSGSGVAIPGSLARLPKRRLPTSSGTRSRRPMPEAIYSGVAARSCARGLDTCMGGRTDSLHLIRDKGPSAGCQQASLPVALPRLGDRGGVSHHGMQ